MSSRIEQIIEEIEEYIDSCKFQPLSTSKIIVNKDQMDELLRELRMKTPDEIKRYQKIIALVAHSAADTENIGLEYIYGIGNSAGKIFYVAFDHFRSRFIVKLCRIESRSCTVFAVCLRKLLY